MPTRAVAAIALTALACLAAASASAQDPRFAGPIPATGERLIDVAVTYNFAIPVKGDGVAAYGEAMEGARRMLYEIAAKECTVLLATIASTCRLERLNVQSHQQRQMPMQDMIQIGGNASYKIGLK